MPNGFVGIKDITSFPRYVIPKEIIYKKLDVLRDVLSVTPEFGKRHIHLRRTIDENKREFKYLCPICGRITSHSLYCWDDMFELDKILAAARKIRDIGFDIVFEERNMCSKCRISSDMFGKRIWKITIDDNAFYVPAWFSRDCDLLKMFLTAHETKDYERLINYVRGDISGLEKLLGVRSE